MSSIYTPTENLTELVRSVRLAQRYVESQRSQGIGMGEAIQSLDTAMMQSVFDKLLDAGMTFDEINKEIKNRLTSRSPEY